MIPLLWKSKPRIKKAPYGWYKNPEDDRELLPDPSITPFLEEALLNLNNGLSLREMAEWLEVQTKRPITHMGLRKIWFDCFPEKEASVIPRPKGKKLTPEQKEQRKKKLKLAQEKKKLSWAKKTVDKLTEEFTGEKVRKEQAKSVVQQIDYTALDYSVIEEAQKTREVAFEPNPGPQAVFLNAEEFEVLYGGAAGGGKSYALIADPMRYFEHPYFKGVIFRRTNDELRDLIWNAQLLYERAFGKRIRWSQQKSTFYLPGGGTLWFTYWERDEDAIRHQGQQYTYAAFDELTHYPTSYAWDYIRSRVRAPRGQDIPLFMRATTNPGGPGHGWVKRMFIDPAPPNEPFWATDIETGVTLTYPKGHAKEGEPLFKRRFIPAMVKDNPYLWEDGVYERMLMSLPEARRNQLLYGDWTIAEGAAFNEFRTNIHTCKPFEIPHNWRKFRSCDFGYSERQASAVHWYAIEPSTGILYVYRELYVNQLTGRELAQKILTLEHGERIDYGILDSSVWAIRGQTGPSIAEEMIQTGCRWRPSDRSQGSRIDGKNRLHQLLRVDSVNQKPGIIFFDTCRQIISDLPVIPSDPDSDDIDSKYATDHAYDSVRYGVMSRPKAVSWFETTPNEPIYRPASRQLGY